MTYNLTNFTASNNFLDMAVASNALVDGWLFTLVVVLMYAVLFVGFKTYQTKHALAGTGLLMFVFVVVMWGSGLVGDRSLLFSFVVLLFSLGAAIIMD